jgi:hypothetical protein
MLNRVEAVSVIKELLDCCIGLDGQTIQLTPPIAAGGGYQIMLVGTFDQVTITCVQATAKKHGLALQMGNIWKTKRTTNIQPNTLIIYKMPPTSLKLTN